MNFLIKSPQVANEPNYQLANELHKRIIRKFIKRKVYSGFKDNIWGIDLADVQLLSKFNKGFRFLLCVIDIFSKYAWVVPLKDKKGVSIVNAFQKILDDSNRKPNKIWVDKGSEFYNNSFISYYLTFVPIYVLLKMSGDNTVHMHKEQNLSLLLIKICMVFFLLVFFRPFLIIKICSYTVFICFSFMYLSSSP